MSIYTKKKFSFVKHVLNDFYVFEYRKFLRTYNSKPLRFRIYRLLLHFQIIFDFF